jgi:hypothetical protein
MRSAQEKIEVGCTKHLSFEILARELSQDCRASFFRAEAFLKSHSAESVFRKLITFVILPNSFFASQ